MNASLAFRASLTATWLMLALGVTGCSKPQEPAPPTKVAASPSPSSSLAPPQDFADEAADKFRSKADKTIKALNGFLKSDDSRLQVKLQKLTDKIGRDKDTWRRKLQEKREELQPQIEQLKEKVARAEGKSKAEVDHQLAQLEAQSKDADKKLMELEGATGDAWKKFKARLKESEAKNDSPVEGNDMPPTPTPAP